MRLRTHDVSLLHWLIAFEPEIMDCGVETLISAGADVNSVSSGKIVYHFYSYYLPKGTPLNWAITASNSRAVKVLLEHGANPLIRNGEDSLR